jgi:hypothetical protein
LFFTKVAEKIGNDDWKAADKAAFDVFCKYVDYCPPTICAKESDDKGYYFCDGTFTFMDADIEASWGYVHFFPIP